MQLRDMSGVNLGDGGRAVCFNDHAPMAMTWRSGMKSSHDLVPMRGRGNIPIAKMRSVYRCDEVERRLDQAAAQGTRKPARHLRAHARERARALPGQALRPAGDGPPVRRDAQLHRGARRREAPARAVPGQPRRARDHADAAAGPAGRRQDAFRAPAVAAARHRHGLRLDELAHRRLGAVAAHRRNGRAHARARSSRPWSTASTPTR